MRYKIFLFISLFLVISTKTFAAVFVVTSNADSGPGTLREALTLAAANGSSEKDYINFNLPDLSEAGRTITLGNKLPNVSSNMVINGSTQPGAPFGRSDAKIQLLFNAPAQDDFAGLSLINQSQIEIYGLYIKNLTDYSYNNLYPAKGIKITNTNDVKIGDVGKGNVVSGFTLPLAENLRLTNDSASHNNFGLSLKCNFWGIDSDGQTISPFSNQPVSMDNVFKTITMGGTPNEGNLFATGLYIDFDGVDTPTYVQIKNNKIGVNFNVTETTSVSWGIGIQTSDYYMPANVEIEDNVISKSHGFGDIFCINLKGKINILRNFIEVDKTKKIQLNKNSNAGFGIYIDGCDTLQIGSSNPNNANYIAYCQAIRVENGKHTTFNKNSIFCAYNEPVYYDSFYQVRPKCAITKISSNSINGTSDPNASIELFYSDECKTCSPQTFFASTIADADGNWTYNGTISGTVIASATYQNETSNFTKPNINSDNIKIIYACNNGFGSIIGAVPYSAASIKWVNDSGNVVGVNPDLVNVKIGKYKLIIQNGECKDSTSYYEIKNRFQIDTSLVKITAPSCGNLHGTISGISITGNDPSPLIIKWKDANGVTIIENKLILENVPIGSYYLTVESADNTCSDTYGPFILKNVSGPKIDQSNADIQSTPCGQSTGSITNLAVIGTGTLKYTWRNSQQQTVSNSIDLLNQPAGIYKLQVTDDTQCGAVYSTDIQIPETNGINIDESTAQTTIAKCGLSNGSITGIKVTGAINYTWAYGLNSKINTTSPDLLNMPPGDYVLTASNSFGCVKSSSIYHIMQQASTLYPVYDVLMKFACFGQQNGSIEVSTDGTVKAARWVNSLGQTVGNASTLSAVGAGTYQLFLTDAGGCETFYLNYTLPSIPKLQITPASESITTDQCNLKTGSIKNIQVSGGTAPYTYSWTDAGNNPVASTLALTGLGAGIYTLTVNDASRCGAVSATYTVLELTSVIAPPSVSNLDVCSAGEALLQVNNPSATYKYRLYESNSSPTPIDEQVSGSFKIAAKTNTSLFVSQVTGSCESARAEVKISVGLTSLNIANTFTPNGDGINDYWKIKGVESYPKALVRIFNRYGLQLFESKGYTKPFDGTYVGKPLPAGVYYFIINLNTDCNILSGSLTIVR